MTDNELAQDSNRQNAGILEANGIDKDYLQQATLEKESWLCKTIFVPSNVLEVVS
jgi:hypothetical protein